MECASLCMLTYRRWCRCELSRSLSRPPERLMTRDTSGIRKQDEAPTFVYEERASDVSLGHRALREVAVVLSLLFQSRQSAPFHEGCVEMPLHSATQRSGRSVLLGALRGRHCGGDARCRSFSSYHVVISAAEVGSRIVASVDGCRARVSIPDGIRSASRLAAALDSCYSSLDARFAVSSRGASRNYNENRAKIYEYFVVAFTRSRSLSSKRRVVLIPSFP
jgi:hypothetical protein